MDNFQNAPVKSMKMILFILHKTNLYQSLAAQSDSKSKRGKPRIQMNLPLPIALHSAWPRVDLSTAMDRVMNFSSALNTHFICKAYIRILSVKNKTQFLHIKNETSGVELSKRLYHIVFESKSFGLCHTYLQISVSTPCPLGNFGVT